MQDMVGPGFPHLAGPLSFSALRDLSRANATSTWAASNDSLLVRSSATIATMPIPSLLIGYDESRAAVPPFILPLWEKMALEPYSAPRNVRCVAMVPDSKYLIGETATFLREVGCAYQMLRLGTHLPLARRNMGLKEDCIWGVSCGDAKGMW